MKKLALFCLLLATPLSWGQYTMNYQASLVDLTTYCTTAGNSCWKAFPTIVTNWLALGQEGTVGVVTNTNNVYLLNSTHTQWIIHHELGQLYQQIAIQDSTHMFLLSATQGTCSTGNFHISTWDGVNSPVQVNGCLKQIYAGDGILVGASNQATASKSTDGGNTWTEISTLQTSYVAASDASDICEISLSSQLYLQTASQTSPTLFSPAPPGTPSGCALNPDADDNPVLAVWTSTGAVELYNWTTGTWTTVPGLSVKYLTAYNYGAILAMATSAGQPYHFNVYAGGMSGTINGSTNGCPTSSQQCTSQVYHDGYVKIQLPHGIAGTVASQHVLHDTYMNVTSNDYSPTCDPLFGDPSDPECQATDSIASVVCEVSGFDFMGPQGNPPPPPPPVPGQTFSVDAKSFDGNITYLSFATIPGGAIGTANCGITVNACTPFTAPTCPTSVTKKFVRSTCTGQNCTRTVVNGAMLDGCNRRKAPNGSWQIAQPFYRPNPNGPLVCEGYYFFKAAPWLVTCQ